MWGEIESCAGSNSPARGSVCRAADCGSDQHENPKSNEIYRTAELECGPVKNKDGCPDYLFHMIEAIAVSNSPVKSQQLGEPDLTLEQRRAALLEQYHSKPLVFLERYQAYLKPEHLGAFSHLNADCRVQFYSDEVRKRASGQSIKTSIKNHRYAALRALQQEGQYFSEEQMRNRDPLLYEHYIGQYLSEDELSKRSEGLSTSGAASLSDLLINTYQERLLQCRLQQQQDQEECAREESEEDEDEVADEAREQEWEPSPEEKALLREEFVSQMHQRFLDGKDKDFNYSEVDENPDYDNLDILNRDAEERYFDEDDGEEDKEENEDGDEQEEEAMQ